MQRALAVAALLLFGCARPRPAPLYFQAGTHEGEGTAVWVAWRALGRADVPPTVQWVEGAALRCHAADGKVGWDEPGFEGYCLLGLTQARTHVRVAWGPHDFFSTTAMAHEFEHVKLMREFGDNHGDASHSGPWWQPGGEVDQVNRALMLEGL